MIEGFGSVSVSLTNGSGSRRIKNVGSGSATLINTARFERTFRVP
jgi:hypothetical protein